MEITSEPIILFGAGDGAFMVPVAYEVFGAMDVADEVPMPMTVGTSLAIILRTSIKFRGVVDHALLQSRAMPIVAGFLTSVPSTIGYVLADLGRQDPIANSRSCRKLALAFGHLPLLVCSQFIWAVTAQ